MPFVTLSAEKNDFLISSKTVCSFIIVTLIILLHDRRHISVLRLGVQSLIHFYFLYVRRRALESFLSTFIQLLGVHQTVRSYPRALGVVSTVGDLEFLPRSQDQM